MTVAPLGDRQTTEVFPVETRLKTLWNRVRRGHLVVCGEGNRKTACEGGEMGASHVGNHIRGGVGKPNKFLGVNSYARLSLRPNSVLAIFRAIP